MPRRLQLLDPSEAPTMHYGRNTDAPVVQAGDLATYYGIRGVCKVKVVGLVRNDFHDTVQVRLQVTEHNHPLYDRGDLIHTSPTFVSKRERST